VAEILKVMTESPPFKLISPLRSELTNLLQKMKVPLAMEEKVGGQKKRRIVNIMQAIEQTPPSASAVKAAIPVDTEDAGGAETEELAATMLEIDKLISYVVTEETGVAAEESMAAVPNKGKKVVDTSSGEKDFDLRHLGGQELSEEDRTELKEFAMSCGYQPRSMLFGGVDEEILGCNRDRVEAKIIDTLSKSIGFPKLESNISCYRRQHIVGTLFYSNFKVRLFSKLSLSLFFFYITFVVV
jgi:hypothetical protein